MGAKETHDSFMRKTDPAFITLEKLGYINPNRKMELAAKKMLVLIAEDLDLRSFTDKQ